MQFAGIVGIWQPLIIMCIQKHNLKANKQKRLHKNNAPKACSMVVSSLLRKHAIFVNVEYIV